MSVYNLKVYRSLVFSTFTALCSDHHHLITEHFHQPKTDPHTTQLPYPKPW